MGCDPTHLISARLSNADFLALEAQVSASGISRSDLIRAGIAAALMSPADVVAMADLARQRAQALAQFADAETTLRKAGGLFAVALRQRRPVSEEEHHARLRAVRSVRRTARALVAR